MPSFDLRDIQRNISSKTLAGAQYYLRQGRVRDIDCSEDLRTLVGRVQDNQTKPYEQHIRIIDLGRQTQIIGHCSCEKGSNCKHVAAVLLAALERHGADRNSRGAKPVDPDLTRWLAELAKAAAPELNDDYPPEIRHRLIYVLETEGGAYAHPSSWVRFYSVRLLEDGSYGPQPMSYAASNAFNDPPANFLRPSDLVILQDLVRHRAPHQKFSYRHRLDGEVGGRLIALVLATGRCHWQTLEGPLLRQGAPRRGASDWQLTVDGRQRPTIAVDEGTTSILLPLTPPHYLDAEKGEVGIIETDLPPRLAAAFLQAPMVKPADVPRLVGALEQALPKTSLPRPTTPRTKRRNDIAPAPHLLLTTTRLKHSPSSHWTSSGDHMAAIARLGFVYDGMKVGAADRRREIAQAKDGEIVNIARQSAAEEAFQIRLEGLGFEPVKALGLYEVAPEQEGDFIMIGLGPDADLPDPAKALLLFSYHHLPVLRAEGWQIEIDESYPVDLVEADEEWFATVAEHSGIDWFGIELGVTVDGTRLSLLPILLDYLKAMHDGAGLEDLDALIDGDEVTFVPLPDGRLVPLPSTRLRPLLAALFELFEVGAIGEDGSIRLNPRQSADLADLAAATAAINLRWLGGESLLELGSKLKAAGTIEPVEPPSAFRADLRTYQKQGLGWLQFLREVELGGILADDMGLGKTVQTLAHLLIEKQSGRADLPSLVVAPTSLMANWRLEALRFAPDLKVLVLHGSDRDQRFEVIGDHDVVLTTYALLRHDKQVLLNQPYHFVILDEAQNIKNAKATVTRLVHQLKARHRLCLTGTPLENHLGELWSLCHFLNPGLLGDSQTFRRVFSTPIEKHQDTERARLLARRVKPYLLRRTKDEVAKELPKKTEIVENIELEGAQRDLYESIRLAMHEKVRREIAAKGAARSHIVLLDALLKLRQVCCDPRLLKLDAARKVKESAKLTHLVDMLPAMVEDGRRILLFSQFTSMLALIENEVRRLGLGYQKLTGQTKQRAGLIERFQAGKVPVFLISLKAGGSGLNLTAADTVIHYDPWWNPAVEDQATDRAHRIGQDKPVFVFKLRTLGTVEERIMELQAKKRNLADGLFNGTANSSLDDDDIASLFAPIGT